MSITYDEFVAACTRIASRGHRPSYRLVTAELGRGSHSTMRELFARWRAEQAEKQTIAAETSPELTALESLAPGATARLREAFRAEVAAEVARLTDALEAARREAEDLHEVIVSRERETDVLRQRAETAEQLLQAFQELRHQVDHIGSAMAEHSSRLTTIEGRTSAVLSAAEIAAQAAMEGQRQAAAAAAGVAEAVDAQKHTLIVVHQGFRTQTESLESAAREAQCTAQEHDLKVIDALNSLVECVARSDNEIRSAIHTCGDRRAQDARSLTRTMKEILQEHRIHHRTITSARSGRFRGNR